MAGSARDITIPNMQSSDHLGMFGKLSGRKCACVHPWNEEFRRSVVLGKWIFFETGNKLEIYLYLFNHHYDSNNPKILTPIPSQCMRCSQDYRSSEVSEHSWPGRTPEPRQRTCPYAAEAYQYRLFLVINILIFFFFKPKKQQLILWEKKKSDRLTNFGMRDNRCNQEERKMQMTCVTYLEMNTPSFLALKVTVRKVLFPTHSFMKYFSTSRGPQIMAMDIHVISQLKWTTMHVVYI